MAIKDSYENWVRGKPVPAMILVVAVGIVIGGALGAGAGFKVEQNRTRADVKRLQQQIKLQSDGGAVVGLGPLGQEAGTVTATATDSFTLATKRQGTQQVKTTAATQIETTTTGKTSDIAVGRRVLVTINGRDDIVLPTDVNDKFGRQVTNVGTNSFSITKALGKGTAKILFKNVKDVQTTTTGASSDIKKGSLVIAGGRGPAKGPFAAVEVILLPAGTGFVG